MIKNMQKYINKKEAYFDTGMFHFEQKNIEKARQELEEMLEERIHLFLFVKVRENWENDPARYNIWGLKYNI